MHKGVILLVKATTGTVAINKAKAFLAPYGDSKVWDWYQVGGRWTGTLDGYDPADHRENYETCFICNGKGMRRDSLGRAARLEDPNYKCNGCTHYNEETKTYEYSKFGKGLAPMWPSKMKPHEGDCLPLSKCITKVKEWEQDPEAEAVKEMREAEERWGKLSDKPNKDMYSYCKKIASRLRKAEFCFDCNVFNVETKNYSIPTKLAGWYAVMIDMHN